MCVSKLPAVFDVADARLMLVPKFGSVKATPCCWRVSCETWMVRVASVTPTVRDVGGCGGGVCSTGGRGSGKGSSTVGAGGCCDGVVRGRSEEMPSSWSQIEFALVSRQQPISNRI